MVALSQSTVSATMDINLSVLMCVCPCVSGGHGELQDEWM